MNVEERSAPRAKPTSDLTDFGLYVFTLMLSRGYKTTGRLAAAMKEDGENGYTITRQAIDNYLAGKRNVPASFVVRLTEFLNLDEDERSKLSNKFAYGQEKS